MARRMTDEEHEEFREEMKEQNEEIRAYLDSLDGGGVDADAAADD